MTESGRDDEAPPEAVPAAPPPEDDLDEFLTPTRRFVRASLPVVGAIVALAMVIVLVQPLIDAWLFDRAGDRVAEELADADRRLAASVLLVTTVACDGRGGSGTAFVADIDGTTWVLTNRHVVEGAATVGVRSLIGEGLPRVTSWRLAGDEDVAVLQLDDRAPLPAALPVAPDGAVRPAAEVRAVGFPTARPFTSTGTIESVQGTRATAAVRTEPGASGSPVVGATDGLVIGQIFARTSERLGVLTTATGLRRAVRDLSQPIAPGTDPERGQPACAAR